MQIIKYKDGNGYVAKDPDNRYKRVSNIKDATQFEDGEAKKFIQNCVQKLFRDKMLIVRGEHLPEFKSELETEIPAKNDNGYQIEDTPFNSLDFDWCKKLRQEDEFRANLDTYKNNLPKMHKKVEREICDIEHFIELNKFSASEGYKLCKLLKEKQMLRRKIKNEIIVVNVLYEDWVKEQKSRNVIGAIEGFKTRIYTPRELTELFEGR